MHQLSGPLQGRRSHSVPPEGRTGRPREKIASMEQLHAVVGPLATNVYVLADPRSREAIAIDTAIPCLEWISGALAERDWTLKLIVSTHGHWDHTGANAAVQAHTGAPIAVHPDDAYRLISPSPLYAPFEIPPCVPAVDLAEGGEVRFGDVRLRVLHTPGHTEGSVCLLASETGELFSGDTLFPGGPGATEGRAAFAAVMASVRGRLFTLPDDTLVLPGHGPATTLGAERPSLDEWERRGW